MVYDSINFVRGVVISDKDLRRLAKSMPNVAKELKEMYNEQMEKAPEFSRKWWDIFYDECGSYEVVHIINSELEKEGVTIQRWPCCSDLCNEQYIIGVVYGSPEVDEIFNGEVAVPETPSSIVDATIKEVVAKFGLDLKLPIKSIMMLNDCTSCT